MPKCICICAMRIGQQSKLTIKSKFLREIVHSSKYKSKTHLPVFMVSTTYKLI
jgi:hypothetical protein